jgi:hypothetical protein
LIVLDTQATAERLRANRDAIAQTFPMRAEGLTRLIGGERVFPHGASRALAAIDPASRRKKWLRPTVIDGRRGSAAYQDYAGFVRGLRR